MPDKYKLLPTYDLYLTLSDLLRWSF